MIAYLMVLFYPQVYCSVWLADERNLSVSSEFVGVSIWLCLWTVCNTTNISWQLANNWQLGQYCTIIETFFPCPPEYLSSLAPTRCGENLLHTVQIKDMISSVQGQFVSVKVKHFSNNIIWVLGKVWSAIHLVSSTNQDHITGLQIRHLVGILEICHSKTNKKK